jgi:glycosyltransferase involved in cell wall biosynthesis
MKIGLVADPCDPQAPGGLGRSIYEWTRAVLAEGGHEFVVYAKDPSVFEGARERHALPAQVWTRGAGVLDASTPTYLFFTPNIPLGFRPKRAVVVAADFAYLDLPQKGLRERAYALASYLMHRRSLWMAERIACMSAATKESAIKHFGLAPEKLVVTPISAMPLAPVERIEGLPQRFFFFAGALKERKNVANLIRAFALYRRAGGDASFIIAGKTGDRYYDELAALAQAQGVSDSLRFIGYVSDGQVAYLYEKALALVFVSIVEGFGMPVLEAMREGCPVITADRGAVAEIAGDAALLADPYNPEAIATQMTRIAGDFAFRQSLIARGKAQAARYSWEASAKALLEVVSAA